MSWRGLDYSGSGWRQVTGSCESSNEHPGSLQFGGFPYSLRNLSSQQGLCFVEVVVTKICSEILIHIGGPLQTWAYIFNFFVYFCLWTCIPNGW